MCTPGWPSIDFIKVACTMLSGFDSCARGNSTKIREVAESRDNSTIFPRHPARYRVSILFWLGSWGISALRIVRCAVSVKPSGSVSVRWFQSADRHLNCGGFRRIHQRTDAHFSASLRLRGGVFRYSTTSLERRAGKSSSAVFVIHHRPREANAVSEMQPADNDAEVRRVG